MTDGQILPWMACLRTICVGASSGTARGGPVDALPTGGLRNVLGGRESQPQGFTPLPPASLLRNGPWRCPAKLPCSRSSQSNSAEAAVAAAAVHQELTSQPAPDVPEAALPLHGVDAALWESNQSAATNACDFRSQSQVPTVGAQPRQRASLSAPAMLTHAPMTANMHSGGAGLTGEPAIPASRHPVQACLRTPPCPLTHTHPHPLQLPQLPKDHASVAAAPGVESLSRSAAVPHGRQAQLPWLAANAAAAPHSSSSFPLRPPCDLQSGYWTRARVPHNHQWLVECSPAPQSASDGPDRQHLGTRDGGVYLASGCRHGLNRSFWFPSERLPQCGPVFP